MAIPTLTGILMKWTKEIVKEEEEYELREMGVAPRGLFFWLIGYNDGLMNNESDG